MKNKKPSLQHSNLSKTILGTIVVLAIIIGIVITISKPAADSKSETQLLYDNLVQNGAKKIDIIVVNSPDIIKTTDDFGAIVEKEKALTIGSAYLINADEKSFQGLIKNLKKSNPDYIILMLNSPALDTFLKQYKEAKMSIPLTGIKSLSNLQNQKAPEK